MGGGFPTHPKNFLTPAGYPAIQLNSDTVYPEMAADSTGKGLSPTGQFPLPLPLQTLVRSPGSYLRFRCPATHRRF